MSLAFLAPFLLSACGKEDPLAAQLASLQRSSQTGAATQTVVLTELYGAEWSEFAAVCPYSPKEAVAEALGVEDAPVPDDGLNESENLLVLRDGDSNTQWVRFAREAVDFCAASSPTLTGLEPATARLSFTQEQSGGPWILTRLN